MTTSATIFRQMLKIKIIHTLALYKILESHWLTCVIKGKNAQYSFNTYFPPLPLDFINLKEQLLF
mgnify:CR=1 FL=1